MERIEFDLEEYRALRAEIIRSMEDGNQIMTFGLGAVGLVLGVGISQKDTLLGFLVLGLFLPVLTACVLSLWFAAQQRIARASHYLTGVEIRIKSAFKDEQSVSWEAWLRTPDPRGKQKHFWSTEQAGIALFGLIIVSSIVLSLASGGKDVSVDIKSSVITVSALMTGFMTVNVGKRYKKWKNWLSSSYDPGSWNAPSPLPFAHKQRAEPDLTASGL